MLPRMRRAALLGFSLVAVAGGAASCGTGTSSGFGADGGHGGSTSSSGGTDDAGSLLGGDAGPSFPDAGGPSNDGGGGASVTMVYAQSADTLYRLDPASKQVAVVGPFTGGCTSVIDIAIDSSSNAYVTTSNDLWKVSLQTAACTHISSGNYPNSLSFVPKGTLDPNAETLVGYFGSQYIRIDTTTGLVTNVGALTGGYTSSGDIVSVIGGGTFLTVKGGSQSCDDCLLQIDPKTGDLVQSYGTVNHTDVFGLAFWAGTAYGFDNAGQVFSIGWQNGQLVTSDIPVPNPPPGLSFWGAGSSTSAPPTSADGGGIPNQ
jgi:predicted small secreted protein